MVYKVKYDEKNYSVVITKTGKEDWFTPGKVLYDVKPYDGFLKDMSTNLDIVIPVNDFKDYTHIYSNVFIEELEISIPNNIIGTSFGDNYRKLKDIIYPIFEEVYKTKTKKKLHFYFENGEGQVKYIFLDIIYAEESIVIVYNNTTDPLLNSSQQIHTSKEFNEVSYNYIKDINGSYFYDSNIYELVEREFCQDDFKRDIICDLVVPEDKELYNSLITGDTQYSNTTHNNVYIQTKKGTRKSLVITSSKLYVGKELSQVAVTITDISKNIERNNKLLMNKLLTIIDNKLGVGTYIKDKKTGACIISNALCDKLHLSKPEAHNLDMDYKKYLIDEEDHKYFDDFYNGKIQCLEREVRYKSPNCDKNQHLFVYLNRYIEDDSDIFFMGIKEISREIKIQKNLLSQNHELMFLTSVVKDIQESTSLAISYMDSKGKFHWSDEIYRIIDRYPRPEDEDINILAPLVSYDDQIKMESIIYNSIDDELFHNDFLITTETGKEKYIRTTARKIFDDEGNFLRLSMSAQDISKQKEYEKQLVRNTEEKNVLVQEVHHRVKNNLQIIMSFINLEKRFHKGNYEKILDVTERRIGALALIHERTYKDENMDYMNVPVFLEDLDKQLYARSRKRGYKFVTSIDEDLTFSINTVTPLSLIINELTANTFKYAFDDEDKSSKIIFKSLELFEKDGKKFCKFKYKDNGSGLPEGFDLTEYKGLGWQIITSLARQMDAEYEIIDDNGVGMSLTFPVV